MMKVEHTSDTTSDGEKVMLDFYDPVTHTGRTIDLSVWEYQTLVRTLQTLGGVPEIDVNDLAEVVRWTDKDDDLVIEELEREIEDSRDELLRMRKRAQDAEAAASAWENRFDNIFDKFLERGNP